MANQFTETSRQSWGSRIMGSIKGIVVGIILFLASFILLWWNEGNSVEAAKSIAEVAENVISGHSVNIDSNNEGKLVHVVGNAETTETLSDNDFNVHKQALKLVRQVEMYQWIQKSSSKTEKNLGGSEETVTTYNYEQGWAKSVINSSNFKEPNGHQNPGSMPYNNASKVAKHVTLGSYTLNESLVGQINKYDDVQLSDENKAKNGKSYITNDNQIYIGNGNEGYPQIGDVKVSFQVVYPKEVSVIAKQTGNTFVPYLTEVGKTEQWISLGNKPIDLMVANKEAGNTFLTWILRLAGFLLMLFGLRLIFKPIVVLADVVPFLGTILNIGIGLVAGLVAFILSFVTIALAWIYYRPILGIALLVIAGIAAFYLWKKGKDSESRKIAKV